MDSLKELSVMISEFCTARDWDKFHSPANLAKSISIEASELLECFQWDDNNFSLDDVKEELADVVNYCIQMATKLDIDLKEIVIEKIKKNEAKYPVEKSKGVSTKYDRL